MKTTKSAFLVTVAGVAGNWRTSSGGVLTAAITKDYDGGATKPDLLGGLVDASDMTVVRSFDPDRDLPILEQLRPLVGRGYFTISKQATDANGTKIGKPIVYPNCLLSSMSYPDHDSAASAAAEFTLVFGNTGPA